MRNKYVDELTMQIGQNLQKFEEEQPEGPCEADVVYDTILNWLTERASATEAWLGVPSGSPQFMHGYECAIEDTLQFFLNGDEGHNVGDF